MFFVSKGNLFDVHVYYTAAGVSAVWRRKNVSPYFTIVKIIFIFHFLWDHWVYCGIFENGAAHAYARGVSSVVNLITAYEESQ